MTKEKAALIIILSGAFSMLFALITRRIYKTPHANYNPKLLVILGIVLILVGLVCLF